MHDVSLVALWCLLHLCDVLSVPRKSFWLSLICPTQWVEASEACLSHATAFFIISYWCLSQQLLCVGNVCFYCGIPLLLHVRLLTLCQLRWQEVGIRCSFTVRLLGLKMKVMCLASKEKWYIVNHAPLMCAKYLSIISSVRGTEIQIKTHNKLLMKK